MVMPAKSFLQGILMALAYREVSMSFFLEIKGK